MAADTRQVQIELTPSGATKVTFWENTAPDHKQIQAYGAGATLRYEADLLHIFPFDREHAEDFALSFSELVDNFGQPDLKTYTEYLIEHNFFNS